MPTKFDAYQQWFGISPSEQPPNRYRLLGISLLERNPAVIESAAAQRAAQLQSLCLGVYAEHSLRLLNEVAAARYCLLDPGRKAAYDRSLREKRRPSPAAEAALVTRPETEVVDLELAEDFEARLPSSSGTYRRRRSAKSQSRFLAQLSLTTVSVAAVGLTVAWLAFGRSAEPERRGRDIVKAAPTAPLAPLKKDVAKASHTRDNALRRDTAAGREKAARTDAVAALHPRAEIAASVPLFRQIKLPVAVREAEDDVKTPPVVERMPVPSQADQAKAAKTAKEVYGEKYARAATAKMKEALARELLAKAAVTRDNPAARFVLLKIARDVSVQAVSAESALRAVDDTADAFQVDRLQAKTEALSALAKKARSEEKHELLAEQAVDLMAAASVADSFEIALRLGDLAATEARNAKDLSLLGDVKAKIADAKAMATSFAETKSARKTLESLPADPAANLIVGKYLCLEKGEWDEGLPLLRMGGEGKLQATAARELAGPASPEEQVDLADAWWDLAAQEKGSTKTHLQEHARQWYNKARPQADGLTRDKIDVRLAAATEEGAWRLVFRSANPRIWNTDVRHSPNEYAIPVAKLRGDIKFLRLQLDRARFVIIAITKDRLLARSAEGRFGWEGGVSLQWGAYHLGIYDTEGTDARIALTTADDGHARSGWGFGHRNFFDDRKEHQAYSWAGGEIPKTVFEVSVKSVALTPIEREHVVQ